MNEPIVVTGAGTGIGAAIATVLAEMNYSLILLSRNRDNLERVRLELKNPDAHRALSCDIRDRGQIPKALSASGVSSLFGVVANAGLGGENHYGEGDRWREIIETNLTGTYNTIKECLPYLRKSAAPYKRIIINSSILARLGVPGYTAYCASKAGLLGLMRSFAVELAPEKILVNALCPGWVDTEMTAEGLRAFAEAQNISRDEAYKNAMQEVPLGKMSDPIEIGGWVAFLFSDAQTSLTGQTFDINNGALMA